MTTLGVWKFSDDGAGERSRPCECWRRGDVITVRRRHRVVADRPEAAETKGNYGAHRRQTVENSFWGVLSASFLRAAPRRGHRHRRLRRIPRRRRSATTSSTRSAASTAGDVRIVHDVIGRPETVRRSSAAGAAIHTNLGTEDLVCQYFGTEWEGPHRFPPKITLRG